MECVKSDGMKLIEEADIVHVRQLVRRLSQEVGMGLVDQTKIITAASELARNVVKYAGSGEMKWQQLRRDSKKGLRLIFSDRGPGIADIELAMTDGWTSGGGLGLGLSGSKRLVHDFEIRSEVGVGTEVSITRWI